MEDNVVLASAHPLETRGESDRSSHSASGPGIRMHVHVGPRAGTVAATIYQDREMKLLTGYEILKAQQKFAAIHFSSHLREFGKELSWSMSGNVWSAFMYFALLPERTDWQSSTASRASEISDFHVSCAESVRLFFDTLVILLTVH